MAAAYRGHAYYGHTCQVRCLAPSAFCEVIAEVCGVGRSAYYLGTTRMFFRMGAAAFLEELQVHAYLPWLLTRGAFLSALQDAHPTNYSTLTTRTTVLAYDPHHLPYSLQDADPAVMGPVLVQKLELFEKKKVSLKPTVTLTLTPTLIPGPPLSPGPTQPSTPNAHQVARREIEKSLHMYVHVRRYRALLAAARAAEEEARLREVARLEREAEAARVAEETRKRLAEAEKLRREAEAEEARRHADAAAKAREEAEAEAALRTLSSVEAACLEMEEADGDAGDADLERAVQAAGGVPALIGMAAKHADSGAVQAQFAGVLRDLCISDEIALEIHAAGGVTALLDAARRHFHSVDVQGAAAGALRHLAVLTHSPTHSPTHSLTHPLTHPPTHSLTYSLTRLLTHSLTLLTYLLTHLLTKARCAIWLRSTRSPAPSPPWVGSRCSSTTYYTY